jgi:DNA repair exonuclease SbcCD ATPase subunit
MSKGDIIAFIKSYVAEFSLFATSARELIKKVEDRSEVLKKEDEEQKMLNNQLKENIEELTKEIEELIKEIEKLRSNESEIIRIRGEYEDAKKHIEQLKAELIAKSETITNNEKQIETLSVSIQNNSETFKVEETKLKKQIERQKGIIEEMRQENEQCALEKASEANKHSQEKTELKKALSISERTISHLRNEKSVFEANQLYLKKKLDKVGNKVITKETQTEDILVPKVDGVLESEGLNTRLQEELHVANKHSVSLTNELKLVQSKYAQLQGLNSELRKQNSEKTKLLEQIEKEKAGLMKENIDLKKRREQAMSEISKLTQKVQKKVSKPKYFSAAVHYFLL